MSNSYSKDKRKEFVDFTDIKVRFSEIDSLGILWHGNYVQYFEDGREAFGEKAFCHIDGELRFNIENSGKVAIKGIQLRTLDTVLKEVKELVPGSQMAVGGTFSYNTQLADASKLHVELVPYIIVNNNNHYCPKKAIVQDILPECSA